VDDPEKHGDIKHRINKQRSRNMPGNLLPVEVEEEDDDDDDDHHQLILFNE
jgi:hypothetical protein